jgi:hypothetical protein
MSMSSLTHENVTTKETAAITRGRRERTFRFRDLCSWGMVYICRTATSPVMRANHPTQYSVMCHLLWLAQAQLLAKSSLLLRLHRLGANSIALLPPHLRGGKSRYHMFEKGGQPGLGPGCVEILSSETVSRFARAEVSVA